MVAAIERRSHRIHTINIHNKHPITAPLCMRTYVLLYVYYMYSIYAIASHRLTCARRYLSLSCRCRITSLHININIIVLYWVTARTRARSLARLHTHQPPSCPIVSGCARAQLATNDPPQITTILFVLPYMVVVYRRYTPHISASLCTAFVHLYIIIDTVFLCVGVLWVGRVKSVRV